MTKPIGNSGYWPLDVFKHLQKVVEKITGLNGHHLTEESSASWQKTAQSAVPASGNAADDAPVVGKTGANTPFETNQAGGASPSELTGAVAASAKTGGEQWRQATLNAATPRSHAHLAQHRTILSQQERTPHAAAVDSASDTRNEAGHADASATPEFAALASPRPVTRHLSNVLVKNIREEIVSAAAVLANLRLVQSDAFSAPDRAKLLEASLCALERIPVEEHPKLLETSLSSLNRAPKEVRQKLLDNILKASPPDHAGRMCELALETIMSSPDYTDSDLSADLLVVLVRPGCPMETMKSVLTEYATHLMTLARFEQQRGAEKMPRKHLDKFSQQVTSLSASGGSLPAREQITVADSFYALTLPRSQSDLH